MYRFDGSTVLVIKTDVTHTVTHQFRRHIFSHPPGRKTLSTEPEEGVHTASRSVDHVARSIDAGERMAHALDGGEAKNTDGGRPLA